MPLEALRKLSDTDLGKLGPVHTEGGVRIPGHGDSLLPSTEGRKAGEIFIPTEILDRILGYINETSAGSISVSEHKAPSHIEHTKTTGLKDELSSIVKGKVNDVTLLYSTVLSPLQEYIKLLDKFNQNKATWDEHQMLENFHSMKDIIHKVIRTMKSEKFKKEEADLRGSTKGDEKEYYNVIFKHLEMLLPQMFGVNTKDTLNKLDGIEKVLNEHIAGLEGELAGKGHYKGDETLEALIKEYEKASFTRARKDQNLETVFTTHNSVWVESHSSRWSNSASSSKYKDKELNQPPAENDHNLRQLNYLEFMVSTAKEMEKQGLGYNDRGVLSQRVGKSFEFAKKYEGGGSPKNQTMYLTKFFTSFAREGKLLDWESARGSTYKVININQMLDKSVSVQIQSAGIYIQKEGNEINKYMDELRSEAQPITKFAKFTTLDEIAKQDKKEFVESLAKRNKVLRLARAVSKRSNQFNAMSSRMADLSILNPGIAPDIANQQAKAMQALLEVLDEACGQNGLDPKNWLITQFEQIATDATKTVAQVGIIDIVTGKPSDDKIKELAQKGQKEIEAKVELIENALELFDSQDGRFEQTFKSVEGEQEAYNLMKDYQINSAKSKTRSELSNRKRQLQDALEALKGLKSGFDDEFTGILNDTRTTRDTMKPALIHGEKNQSEIMLDLDIPVPSYSKQVEASRDLDTSSDTNLQKYSAISQAATQKYLDYQERTHRLEEKLADNGEYSNYAKRNPKVKAAERIRFLNDVLNDSAQVANQVLSNSQGEDLLREQLKTDFNVKNNQIVTRHQNEIRIAIEYSNQLPGHNTIQDDLLPDVIASYLQGLSIAFRACQAAAMETNPKPTSEQKVTPAFEKYQATANANLEKDRTALIAIQTQLLMDLGTIQDNARKIVGQVPSDPNDNNYEKKYEEAKKELNLLMANYLLRAPDQLGGSAVLAKTYEDEYNKGLQALQALQGGFAKKLFNQSVESLLTKIQAVRTSIAEGVTGEADIAIKGSDDPQYKNEERAKNGDEIESISDEKLSNSNLDEKKNLAPGLIVTTNTAPAKYDECKRELAKLEKTLTEKMYQNFNIYDPHAQKRLNLIGQLLEDSSKIVPTVKQTASDEWEKRVKTEDSLKKITDGAEAANGSIPDYQDKDHETVFKKNHNEIVQNLKVLNAAKKKVDTLTKTKETLKINNNSILVVTANTKAEKAIGDLDAKASKSRDIVVDTLIKKAEDITKTALETMKELQGKKPNSKEDLATANGIRLELLKILNAELPDPNDTNNKIFDPLLNGVDAEYVKAYDDANKILKSFGEYIDKENNNNEFDDELNTIFESVMKSRQPVLATKTVLNDGTQGIHNDFMAKQTGFNAYGEKADNNPKTFMDLSDNDINLENPSSIQQISKTANSKYANHKQDIALLAKKFERGGDYENLGTSININRRGFVESLISHSGTVANNVSNFADKEMAFRRELKTSIDSLRKLVEKERDRLNQIDYLTTDIQKLKALDNNELIRRLETLNRAIRECKTTSVVVNGYDKDVNSRMKSSMVQQASREGKLGIDKAKNQEEEAVRAIFAALTLKATDGIVEAGKAQQGILANAPETLLTASKTLATIIPILQALPEPTRPRPPAPVPTEPPLIPAPPAPAVPPVAPQEEDPNDPTPYADGYYGLENALTALEHSIGSTKKANELYKRYHEIRDAACELIQAVFVNEDMYDINDFTLNTEVFEEYYINRSLDEIEQAITLLQGTQNQGKKLSENFDLQDRELDRLEPFYAAILSSLNVGQKNSLTTARNDAIQPVVMGKLDVQWALVILHDLKVRKSLEQNQQQERAHNFGTQFSDLKQKINDLLERAKKAYLPVGVIFIRAQYRRQDGPTLITDDDISKNAKNQELEIIGELMNLTNGFPLVPKEDLKGLISAAIEFVDTSYVKNIDSVATQVKNEQDRRIKIIAELKVKREPAYVKRGHDDITKAIHFSETVAPEILIDVEGSKRKIALKDRKEDIVYFESGVEIYKNSLNKFIRDLGEAVILTKNAFEDVHKIYFANDMNVLPDANVDAVTIHKESANALTTITTEEEEALKKILAAVQAEVVTAREAIEKPSANSQTDADNLLIANSILNDISSILDIPTLPPKPRASLQEELTKLRKAIGTRQNDLADKYRELETQATQLNQITIPSPLLKQDGSIKLSALAAYIDSIPNLQVELDKVQATLNKSAADKAKDPITNYPDEHVILEGYNAIFKQIEPTLNKTDRTIHVARADADGAIRRGKSNAEAYRNALIKVLENKEKEKQKQREDITKTISNIIMPEKKSADEIDRLTWDQLQSYKKDWEKYEQKITSALALLPRRAIEGNEALLEVAVRDVRNWIELAQDHTKVIVDSETLRENLRGLGIQGGLFLAHEYIFNTANKESTEIQKMPQFVQGNINRFDSNLTNDINKTLTEIIQARADEVKGYSAVVNSFEEYGEKKTIIEKAKQDFLESLIGLRDSIEANPTFVNDKVNNYLDSVKLDERKMVSERIKEIEALIKSCDLKLKELDANNQQFQAQEHDVSQALQNAMTILRGINLPELRDLDSTPYLKLKSLEGIYQTASRRLESIIVPKLPENASDDLAKEYYQLIRNIKTLKREITFSINSLTHEIILRENDFAESTFKAMDHAHKLLSELPDVPVEFNGALFNYKEPAPIRNATKYFNDALTKELKEFEDEIIEITFEPIEIENQEDDPDWETGSNVSTTSRGGSAKYQSGDIDTETEEKEDDYTQTSEYLDSLKEKLIEARDALDFALKNNLLVGNESDSDEERYYLPTDWKDPNPPEKGISLSHKEMLKSHIDKIDHLLAMVLENKTKYTDNAVQGLVDSGLVDRGDDVSDLEDLEKLPYSRLMRINLQLENAIAQLEDKADDFIENGFPETKLDSILVILEREQSRFLDEIWKRDDLRNENSLDAIHGAASALKRRPGSVSLDLYDFSPDSDREKYDHYIETKTDKENKGIDEILTQIELEVANPKETDPIGQLQKHIDNLISAEQQLQSAIDYTGEKFDGYLPEHWDFAVHPDLHHKPLINRLLQRIKLLNAAALKKQTELSIPKPPAAPPVHGINDWIQQLLDAAHKINNKHIKEMMMLDANDDNSLLNMYNSTVHDIKDTNQSISTSDLNHSRDPEELLSCGLLQISALLRAALNERDEEKSQEIEAEVENIIFALEGDRDKIIQNMASNLDNRHRRIPGALQEELISNYYQPDVNNAFCSLNENGIFGKFNAKDLQNVLANFDASVGINPNNLSTHFSRDRTYQNNLNNPNYPRDKGPVDLVKMNQDFDRNLTQLHDMALDFRNSLQARIEQLQTQTQAQVIPPLPGKQKTQSGNIDKMLKENGKPAREITRLNIDTLLYIYTQLSEKERNHIYTQLSNNAADDEPQGHIHIKGNDGQFYSLLLRNTIQNLHGGVPINDQLIKQMMLDNLKQYESSKVLTQGYKDQGAKEYGSYMRYVNLYNDITNKKILTKEEANGADTSLQDQMREALFKRTTSIKIPRYTLDLDDEIPDFIKNELQSTVAQEVAKIRQGILNRQQDLVNTKLPMLAIVGKDPKNLLTFLQKLEQKYDRNEIMRLWNQNLPNIPYDNAAGKTKMELYSPTPGDWYFRSTSGGTVVGTTFFDNVNTKASAEAVLNHLYNIIGTIDIEKNNQDQAAIDKLLRGPEKEDIAVLERKGDIRYGSDANSPQETRFKLTIPGADEKDYLNAWANASPLVMKINDNGTTREYLVTANTFFHKGSNENLVGYYLREIPSGTDVSKMSFKDRQHQKGDKAISQLHKDNYIPTATETMDVIVGDHIAENIVNKQLGKLCVKRSEEFGVKSQSGQPEKERERGKNQGP